MRRTLLILTSALASLALGQRTVAVRVPPGDVVAFATKGRAGAAPIDAVVPKNGVASVSVEGKDTLYVFDRSINRVASAPIRGAEWTPLVSDLKDLGQVVVEVRSGAARVAAANVALDDGRRRQETLLDPGLNGDATFFDVRPGRLTVTVRYRTKTGDASPVTQIFEANAEGDAPPRFAVSLPGEVATVGEKPATTTGSAAPTGEPGAKPAAPKDAGGGFNLVGTLFALIVGGGLAAGAWWYLKKNPDTVGGTLERLGAQIPKPGDAPLADPPVASAPPPAPPAPPPKIVLDPVPSVDLGADPIRMPVPVAVSVSEPSLVSDTGVPIPIPEGETVVGREIGLGLSLAGETTVSRRHATIQRAGGTVTVADAGSTNGTFVNGVPAGGGATLRPGDSVQFGSVRFRYEG